MTTASVASSRSSLGSSSSTIGTGPTAICDVRATPRLPARPGGADPPIPCVRPHRARVSGWVRGRWQSRPRTWPDVAVGSPRATSAPTVGCVGRGSWGIHARRDRHASGAVSAKCTRPSFVPSDTLPARGVMNPSRRPGRSTCPRRFARTRQRSRQVRRAAMSRSAGSIAVHRGLPRRRERDRAGRSERARGRRAAARLTRQGRRELTGGGASPLRWCGVARPAGVAGRTPRATSKRTTSAVDSPSRP